MAEVEAINISEVRGIQKHEIPEAYLREDWGIEGDAHAGHWHRQVSLLSTESVEAMQRKISFPLQHGAFAENILIRGMKVHELPVGTRIQIGQALTEITQIGKECHQDCAIRKATGDCIMPREGVFVKVLRSGKVKKGDPVVLIPEESEEE